MKKHCVFSLLYAGLSLAGCDGSLGNRPSGASHSGRALDDSGTEPVGTAGVLARKGAADTICREEGVLAANAPFLRLTGREYSNTVRDLLGTSLTPADDFSTTAGANIGFDLAVSPVAFEDYSRAAELLAEEAVQDLDALLPCDPAELGELDCAREFIRVFGRRAFRRPVDDGMQTRLEAVFQVGKEEGGFASGIEWTLSAMLQSPFFLYRPEYSDPDPAAELVPLSGYERASRLSYLIWASMPDSELLDAADRGALGDPAEMGVQARRLLEDPRARRPMVQFFLELLELQDFEGIPIEGADARLAEYMRTETEQFVEHVLFEKDGSLEELLTARYTFVNEPLAELYGVPGVTGPDFVRVELNPDERSGLLTHASVLAHTASEGLAYPIFRGKLVRERFFCQPLPDPPADIPALSESENQSGSLREQLARHRSDPSCQGCHQLMDPLGFGFENYDAVGRYFAQRQDGSTVDASGVVTSTNYSNREFEGAVQLTELLAESEDVRQCMANQWLRRGLHRLESRQDRCSLRRVDEAFTASGHNLREMVVALVQTDAFLNRRKGNR